MKKSKAKKLNPPEIGLCHYCEYRRRILVAQATGASWHAPRCECGTVNTATCGCYMYQPIPPLVLRRRAGDPRSVRAPAMFRARSGGVRVAGDADVLATICDLPNGEHMVYYLPVQTQRHILRLLVNKYVAQRKRKGVRREKTSKKR